MNNKYGFGESIELPKPKDTVKPKLEDSSQNSINDAVMAGQALGFVDREPNTHLKPGPKRKEAQDKVTIPGPKRIIDAFRNHCKKHNMTLWEGLESLMGKN